MNDDNIDGQNVQYWQVFESTGNIEYYLKYKGADTFFNQNEGLNATGNQGDCAKGSKNG